MKVHTMRSIDRLAGIPLCWLVAGMIWAFPSRGARARRVPLNILVIKFFGLGSVVLSTAAISTLRSRFPQSRITYLSFESNREYLERVPIIDEVLTINPSTLRTFVGSTLSALLQAFRSRYDITLDFEFFSKFSTLLCGATRAPMRVAFDLPARWRRFIITHPVPLDKDRHVREAFCLLVDAISPPGLHEEIVPIFMRENDLRSVESKLQVDGARIVAINVNAGETFLERRWPAHRFAELISQLAVETDALFVLTGSLSEQKYVQAVIDRTTCPARCRNAAGLFSIPELAALLKRSAIAISNDSGPLHLAASLGTPTIGLFGPESPSFYGPVGPSAQSIYRKTPCSPCMNIYDAKSFQCPYQARCMHEIQVQDVKEAMEEVLELS